MPLEVEATIKMRTQARSAFAIGRKRARHGHGASKRSMPEAGAHGLLRTHRDRDALAFCQWQRLIELEYAI